MANRDLYLGEVVESSLNIWIVQSWKWNKFPSFGSMVAVDTPEKKYYALVHDIKIGSSDPNRSPFTYQKTEEELMSEYPQIFELLRTSFHCLPIGYFERQKHFYFLPSEPAKIHAFVRPMEQAEKEAFFKSDDFLPILFNSGYLNDVDEIISALIKDLKSSDIFDDSRIESFVETYNLLTGNDYKRLKMLLKRISHLVE